MHKKILPQLTVCSSWRAAHKYLIEAITKKLRYNQVLTKNTVLLVPSAIAKTLLSEKISQSIKKEPALEILTFYELLETLSTTPSSQVQIIDPLLREALLDQAFTVASESGHPPPFTVRAGLSRIVFSLYDSLSLKGYNFEEFSKKILNEFDILGDVGAERMVQQTNFLLYSFRYYQKELQRLKLDDTVTIHQSLINSQIKNNYGNIFIFGEKPLQYSEISFLLSFPKIDHLEIILPESMEEIHSIQILTTKITFSITRHKDSQRNSPTFLVPSREKDIVFTARDREEVFTSIAKLLKLLKRNNTLPQLNRIAIIVPDPLPYLYLAKQVFGQSGIPYQLKNGFPLSTEPYLAAFDLIFDFLEDDASHATSFSLLRNPFFKFSNIDNEAFEALAYEYNTKKSLYGADAWKKIRNQNQQTQKSRQLEIPHLQPRNNLSLLHAILETIETIEVFLAPAKNPLTSTITKINCLQAFLSHYEEKTLSKKHYRSKGALHEILTRLKRIDEIIGEAPVAITALRKTIHQAIRAHTFSVQTGDTGIHVLDSSSAIYGDFDLTILVGLNEGEWPTKRKHNIFYPEWLLHDFGWPSDTESIHTERVTFSELTHSSQEHLALFRHQLEDESPTIPSQFLENLAVTETEEVSINLMQSLVISYNQLLREGLAKTKYHKEHYTPGLLTHKFSSLEPISSTAFELYMLCPFKYFSRYILNISEDQNTDEGLTPLQRGRIVHEILRQGFKKLDKTTRFPLKLTEENYTHAYAIFMTLAKEKIPYKYQHLEIPWLFGGLGHIGALEWLLRNETTRPAIEERRLEYPFRTHLKLDEGPKGEKPWYIDVKGRVDRLDIERDGTLSIFDYKTGKAPDSKITLQAPLYAMCLTQEFRSKTAHASYLSLRDKKNVRREDYTKTAKKLREVYQGISEGDFRPRPYHDHLCNNCGYVGICRKEINHDFKLRGSEDET